MFILAIDGKLQKIYEYEDFDCADQKAKELMLKYDGRVKVRVMQEVSTYRMSKTLERTVHELG